MVTDKHKKVILAISVFTWVFCLASFAFAETIKTENKSLIETIPGLNRIEGFRVKEYSQCRQSIVRYKKLVANKDLNTIIDTAKRDLAYEATQNALPEDLRQATNYGYTAGLDDSKNFIKYHTNSICAKFFGSTFYCYGVLVLLLLVIIKGFSK